MFASLQCQVDTLHVRSVGHIPLGYINNEEAIPNVVFDGLNLSDTPFVHKATRDISHLSETLPTSRQTVIGDLGNAIPEVPVPFFFESVCPRIFSQDDALVDKVLSRLTVGPNKIIDDETGRWTDFVILPSASTKHEDPTFKPLENLMKAIGDAAKDEDPGFKCNLVFQNSPYISPVSAHWNSTSRPDGYFRVSGPGKKPHWKDIALCAEYKKYALKETKDDVVAKVIWGMHHCMREDPRRRFTFGLTVEDSEMRLWYVSRTDVMVTQAFDFLMDHRTLIHLALAFLNADPQEAGWDPTMKPVMGRNGKPLLGGDCKPRFDITVHAKDGSEAIFRTTRLISFIGTASMQGRGTRVWEAKRLKDGRESGEPLVLKDCWVDADRLREGTTIRMIREADISEEGRKVLDDHILTVVCHGDVQTKSGIVDHTRDLLTRGKEVSLKDGQFLLRTHFVTLAQAMSHDAGQSSCPSDMPSGSGRKQGSRLSGVKHGSNTAPKGDAGHHRGHDGLSEAVQHRRYYQYHPRVHYRIVFKETALVLRFLHEAGWVHRDLSTGNILVLNGKVRLADFEYAKRLDESSPSHDIRTGTADFMSIEVDDQDYFFLVQESNDAKIKTDDLLDDLSDDESPQVPLETVEVMFRYNPLHDFESLWWISVYFLFNKRIKTVDEAPPPPHDYSQQRSFAADIFYSLPRRQVALINHYTFEKAVGSLSPVLAKFGKSVNVLRTRIVDRYGDIEKNPQNIPSSTAAGEVPIDFIKILGKLGQRRVQCLIGPLPDLDEGVIKVPTKAGETATNSTESRRPKPTDDDLKVRGIRDGGTRKDEGKTEPIRHPLQDPPTGHQTFGARNMRAEGLKHPMQTRSKAKQFAAEAQRQ
ncbi:uncharacterized protein FIBRA_01720 [Fibroporia radiculosa]|uniref:Protein kinase domain-containing protein n=1 Tax=Fibroporia radiculosa TaxID=599839 RepID=J4H1D5_9APHY|nr:uncharacterized protein FIBRA_01720 [Fibroporia radiculosa]CCL99699.1 predicted protein [Fibroporia radiculosa]